VSFYLKNSQVLFESLPSLSLVRTANFLGLSSVELLSLTLLMLAVS